MRVNVLLFASLQDYAGSGNLNMELPQDASVRMLLQYLTGQYPKIEASLPQCRIAVNLEIVERDYLLHNNDEVAIMPPMSGG